MEGDFITKDCCGAIFGHDRGCRNYEREARVTRLADHLKDLKEVIDKPIDIILPCPKCGTLHVDAPEPDICDCGAHQAAHRPDATRIIACSEFKVAWTNPPHKSHLCHGCGLIWRPADVATNGVAEIKTRGEKDSWRSKS